MSMKRKEVIEQLKEMQNRFQHTNLYMQLTTAEMQAVNEAIKLLEVPIKVKAKREERAKNDVYVIVCGNGEVLTNMDGNVAVWRNAEKIKEALRYYKMMLSGRADVMRWRVESWSIDANGRINGKTVVYQD